MGIRLPAADDGRGRTGDPMGVVRPASRSAHGLGRHAYRRPVGLYPDPRTAHVAFRRAGSKPGRHTASCRQPMARPPSPGNVRGRHSAPYPVYPVFLQRR